MERLDVLTIGGGAAGSEATFRIGRGKTRSVGLVERDKLGGECNNYGCVPTKAMLRAAKAVHEARNAEVYGIRVRDIEVDFPKVMERVRGLVKHFTRHGPGPFEELGVKVWLGPTARFTAPGEVEFDDGTRVHAAHVIVATGTKAAVPDIDGLRDAGFWTNEEAIDPPSLPDSIAIVGGGPIGVEFAQIFARLGSQVTVIESLDRILDPEDPAASAALHEVLESDGVRIRTGATLERVERAGGGRRLHLKGGDVIDAAEILMAVGRTPAVSLMEPGAAGIDVDERGRLVVDGSLRTTAPGVFVAGDVTGDLLFTHIASYEGDLVARQILTGTTIDADYRIVPRVTYTDPEIASVGLNETQAADEGIDAVVSTAAFADNERAIIEGSTRGFVKLIGDRRTGRIVGGHIAGAGAGELIHAVVALMAGGTSGAVAAGAIHAYPTLSETLRSAFAGLSR